MIRIRAFRAIDDIEACKRYATGHEKVTKEYWCYQSDLL